MDSTINNSVMSSVQQRTQTKRGKPKKKNNNTNPIKVVYISNPMKVKISASGFRALVQELTGQDAESPPDPSRFHDSDGGGGGGGGDGWHQVVDSDDCLMKKIGHDENVHTLVVPPPPVDNNNPYISQEQQQQQQQPFGGSSIIEGFESFDDAFTPQMIENINSALLW